MRDGRPPLALFDEQPQHRVVELNTDAGASVEEALFDHGTGRPARPRLHTAPTGPRRSWTRRYGPQWGKGLLFGRHAGEYEVHAHREVRGQQRLTDG